MKPKSMTLGRMVMAQIHRSWTLYQVQTEPLPLWLSLWWVRSCPPPQPAAATETSPRSVRTTPLNLGTDDSLHIIFYTVMPPCAYFQKIVFAYDQITQTCVFRKHWTPWNALILTTIHPSSWIQTAMTKKPNLFSFNYHFFFKQYVTC